MKYSLKYLVPIFILILGLTITSVNIYFYSQNEHQQRIGIIKERISIIGNRITTEIEHKQLYDNDSFAELTRIFSQYSLEHLVIANMYNENGELIFKSSPSKYIRYRTQNDKKIIEYVIQEKKSHVREHKSERIIDAVFPVAMPLKNDEIYAKDFGTLYLQFDLEDAHTKLTQNIYTYSFVNALIILLMVSVLAIILYFLILRRLGELHKMTVELSKGNYDVRVKTCLNDELGEVNSAFNKMAQTISQHNKELETKVQESVEKNLQQSRVMMQQNRLVAMGEMINNIAHQWRQPLNTLGLILQKFELFHQRKMLTDEKIRDSVSKGMLQIEKMSSTIDDFRDFFKQDKEKQVFYIKELVDETVELMGTTLELDGIIFRDDIDPTTEIHAYKNELAQVVINIVNNARDALVERDHKDKWIHIGCRVEDEVMIMEIEDNAGGIPANIIDKIFDPYFSTKEEGQGTGIGLYMSKTIIEDNMGGRLGVHNSSVGALFTINLSLDNVHPFCEVACDFEEIRR